MRGGSDDEGIAPIGAVDGPDALGRLHIAWFPAKRATLKGAAAAAYVAFAIHGARPASGALAASPQLWLGARAFASVCCGLLARALDWKLLLALALGAGPLARAAASDGASSLAGAFDITRWTGGGCADALRDKVM